MESRIQHNAVVLCIVVRMSSGSAVYKEKKKIASLVITSGVLAYRQRPQAEYRALAPQMGEKEEAQGKGHLGELPPTPSPA